MDGAKKIATILVSVGEELAAELLTQIPQNERLPILKAMRNIKNVDPKQVEEAHKAFHEALKQSRSPSVSSVSGILAKAFPKDVAENMIDAMGFDLGIGLPALKKFSHKQLMTFLSQEQPQTVAVILAHLEPGPCKLVLSDLKTDLQVEVLRRLAKTTTVESDVLAEINDALEQMWSSTSHRSEVSLGGADSVAKMLASLDQEQAQDILDELTQRDPDLAAAVIERMYTFDKISELTGEGVRWVIGKIDRSQLLVACRLASDSTLKSLQDNMSTNAWKDFAEDLKHQKKLLRSDVEDAQRKIAATIQKALADGDIIDSSQLLS